MQLPNTWTNTLAMVQTFDSTAVISGGAIRDLDNGKTPADLDIFVSYDAPIKQIKKHLSGVCKNDNWSDCIKQYGGVFSGTKGSVVASTKLNTPLAINVTKLNEGLDPRTRWRQHDFGLCQIMFDGKEIEASSDYMHDKENHVLTLCHAENYGTFCRSLERYKRFQAKYPWPLEIRI